MFYVCSLVSVGLNELLYTFNILREVFEVWQDSHIKRIQNRHFGSANSVYCTPSLHLTRSCYSSCWLTFQTSGDKTTCRPSLVSLPIFSTIICRPIKSVANCWHERKPDPALCDSTGMLRSESKQELRPTSMWMLVPLWHCISSTETLPSNS